MTSSALSSELVLRATIQLQDRLGKSVLGLQIFRDENGVALVGRADTYYAKQLAQHLAMDIFGRANVVNEIDVD